ncbi:MAG: hypothetical protein OHK0017_11140 [Patescibacteria group bacterium]
MNETNSEIKKFEFDPVFDSSVFSKTNQLLINYGYLYPKDFHSLISSDDFKQSVLDKVKSTIQGYDKIPNKIEVNSIIEKVLLSVSVECGIDIYSEMSKRVTDQINQVAEKNQEQCRWQTRNFRFE